MSSSLPSVRVSGASGIPGVEGLLDPSLLQIVGEVRGFAFLYNPGDSHAWENAVRALQSVILMMSRRTDQP